MTRDTTDPIRCAVCGEPILTDEYDVAITWPEAGTWHAGHIICVWTIETSIR